jgi:dTDP-4-amino-4,6-dideoxygalactose transaminase
MDKFVAVNYRNYRQYNELLAGIPGIHLVAYDESEKCNFQYMVLEMNEAITHISRDQLQKILWAERILARRYFYPGCHRMEPYRSYFPHAGLLLPNTERLAMQVLSLPTGTAIGTDDIQKICRIIRLVAENGYVVREIISRHGAQEICAH